MDSQLCKTFCLALIATMLPMVTADNAVTAYQCTSDCSAVRDPPALSPENRVLRVCIEGLSSTVKCESVVKATLKQAGNDIVDTLIVGGKPQDAFVETETKGGVCMVAAKLRTDNYFVKGASGTSLDVVLSGSVSICCGCALKDQ